MTEFISSTFLRGFAWTTFEKFTPIGFSLVGIFAVLAIIFHFIESGRGGAESSLYDVFFRIVLSILVIGSFHSLIEGSKDLVWAIESEIQSGGSIEGVLSNFQNVLATGSFWQGWSGGIKGKIASWSLYVCVGLKEIIFLLYQVLWTIAIVLAPLIIPTFIFPILSKLVQWFSFFIIALLLVRIPWAAVSAVIAELVRYLGEHGGGEEFYAFLLFWCAVGITALTPLFSVMALLKSDSLLSHVVASGKATLGLRKLGHSRAKGSPPAAKNGSSTVTSGFNTAREFPEMSKLKKLIKNAYQTRGYSMSSAKSEIKAANTLNKRKELHAKILAVPKLLFFLGLFPIAAKAEIAPNSVRILNEGHSRFYADLFSKSIPPRA